MPRGNGGPFGDGRAALWGLPISVKDCFDLAGAPTSCGVHFYRDLNGIAARDSWLVEQLRAAGAVIIGKTHLHPLAYGITGENPEFGDCVQPRDSDGAHRRLVERRSGQRAGGLRSGRHRHGHRRFRSRARGALRSGGLSRHAGPRRLARRRAPGRIFRHHGLALPRS